MNLQRHTTRAHDARTLYLLAAVPMRVTSTGEALVVTHTDGQVQHLPIRLVQRVLCNADANWSGAALALCMQHRVTVSWLDGSGEPAGHLWPQQPASSDLAPLLHVLAADGLSWPEAYDNWLRHQRLQVLRQWRRQCAEAGQVVSSAEWLAATHAYGYRRMIPEHLPRTLRSMAAALVAHRLADAGLNAHYWACTGQCLALANDLCDLVWAEMNLCAGPLAAAIDDPRSAAAVFERWQGHCAGMLHVHLASLLAQALRHRDD